MTNEMLIDIIEKLHKKIRILTIVSVVLAIFLTAFVILFFMEFEVTMETIVDETTEVEVEQYAEDGNGSNIAVINNEISKGEEESDGYNIIVAIVGCAMVSVICICMISYGKTKNRHKEKKN